MALYTSRERRIADDCKIASLSSERANVRSDALDALRDSAFASDALARHTLVSIGYPRHHHRPVLPRCGPFLGLRPVHRGHKLASASTPLGAAANQARHYLLSNANFIIEKLDRTRDRSRAQSQTWSRTSSQARTTPCRTLLQRLEGAGPTR